MSSGHDVTKDVQKLFTPLPNKILQASIGFKDVSRTHDRQVAFLESRLPLSCIPDITEELNKYFPLFKNKKIVKRNSKFKKTKSAFTSARKRELGLMQLPKKGLSYKSLLVLNNHWQDYMRQHFSGSQILDNQSIPGNCEDVSLRLWKADLHGSILTIVRSKCPSLVGIQGIVLMETRNVFKLLCPDDEVKCVPKATCEFMMKVGSRKVTFLGKNFIMKPPERILRKIKTIYVDL